MKTSLAAAALALVASSTFAQSSSTTTVNGGGLSINAMAQRDVGGETITITIGSGGLSLTKAPSTSPAGVSSATFSAGLSIGAVLGGGFGSTGGTALTQAGLFGSLP